MSDIADPPTIVRRKRRRYRPRTRIPEPIDRFESLKAMAYFEGALRECPRKECARRRQCCGGPRGGFGRHGAIPLCRSEPVVTRAALADKYGAARKRTHGEAWAAEKFAEFRKERQPQAAVREEPKAQAEVPLPLQLRPGKSQEKEEPLGKSIHRTDFSSGSPRRNLRQKKEPSPAAAILELLRHPLDAAAKVELKVQLAALHKRGALMNARYGLTQRQPDQEK